MTTEQDESSRRSRIVFGTFDLPDRDAARLLDRFYAAGGRAVPPANVSGAGGAQRAAGRGLAARGFPDEVLLYGRGCPPPVCTPDHVSSEVERIRRLVGVERVDVFLL